MDILSDIINQSQLTGSVYFCNSFSQSWGYDIEQSERGIFHILIEGTAKLGFEGKVIDLSAGDIIALPNGSAHWIAYDTDAPRDSGSDVINNHDKKLQSSVDSPILSTLLCGYFHLENQQLKPFFNTMPDCLHLSSDKDNYNQWLNAMITKLNHESRNKELGSTLIISRQTELLFIELVRYWLSFDNIDHRLLKAASHPLISKVLNLFHGDANKHYQLETLARDIGMSRASLSKKFHELVGMAPMTYLTKWRIQQASNLLRNTNWPIIDIAIKVGYKTDSSLSKKFKTEIGISPGEYRKKHG